jgi:hypothetical protein
VRLKELADHGGAEHHANALRELFDLPEDEVAFPHRTSDLAADEQD